MGIFQFSIAINVHVVSVDVVVVIMFLAIAARKIHFKSTQAIHDVCCCSNIMQHARIHNVFFFPISHFKEEGKKRCD